MVEKLDQFCFHSLKLFAEKTFFSDQWRDFLVIDNDRLINRLDLAQQQNFEKNFKLEGRYLNLFENLKIFDHMLLLQC